MERFGQSTSPKGVSPTGQQAEQINRGKKGNLARRVNFR
jgi:hypothetical protein